MKENKKRRPRISESNATETSVDRRSVDERLASVREKLYGKEEAGKKDKISSVALELIKKSKSPEMEAFKKADDVSSIGYGKSFTATKELVENCFKNLNKWKEEFDQNKAAQKSKAEISFSNR